MFIRQSVFALKRSFSTTTKSESSEAREKAIALRKLLEVKEAKIAEDLRKICDENGVELNPKESSEFFYNLGKIYQQKFVHYLNTREARFDCIRAAALYEASIQRRECSPKLTTYHKDLYSDFLFFCKDHSEKNAVSKIIQFQSSIKAELDVFRQNLKIKVGNIKDPFHGKNPLESVNHSVERIFQENVEHLLFEGTEFFISFMKKIFDFSESILGKPPCDFALLGLGSLARKEVTLYSDFESIIVLDQENNIKDVPKCKIYFRNYTALAFLIIVSLRETILPSVAVKSLNDFATCGKCWFFDTVSKRGITFDGFMPHASKNPIGRLPTKEKPWATELIQPIDVMLRYLEHESDKKEGYHLADVLLQSTFVTGNKFLAEVFRRTAWKRNQVKLNDPNVNQRDMVYAGLIENIKAFDYSDLNQGKKLHVKRDIYRGITILLPPIGVLTNLSIQSPFALLDNLLVKKKISSLTCHDLKTAIAIANFARIVTYMKREGMSESLSVGMGPKRNSGVKEVFDVAEISALVRLYCVGIQIQKQIKELVKTGDISVLSQHSSEDSVEKGYILSRFEQYDFAIQFFQIQIDVLSNYATVKSEKLADLYYRIGKCYYYKGDINEALRELVLADINCPANTVLRSKILQYVALTYLKFDRTEIAKECLQNSLGIISRLSSMKLASFNSFADLVDNFCSIIGDEITPDLIEMTELAGNILQSKAMYPLALQKYKDVLLKMKNYYGEGSALQRGEVNVLHNIALCQFGLEMYKSSAKTSLKTILETLRLLKLHIPSKGFLSVTSINGTKLSCATILKTFYDSFEKTLNYLEDIRWCIELCNEILNAIHDKTFEDTFVTNRIKTKLQFLIGELYVKDNNLKTAITYYKHSGENFKKLYSQDHILSIQRQAHCHHLLNENVKSLRLYCVALSMRYSSSDWFYKDKYAMDILQKALQKWNACDKNADLVQQIIVLSMTPLCKHDNSQTSILAELDKELIYNFFEMFFKACIKHKNHVMGIDVLFKLVGACCYHALCSDSIYSVKELVLFLRLFIDSHHDKTEPELITYSLIIEALIYMSDKDSFYLDWGFDTTLELKLECLKPKTKFSLYLSAGCYYVKNCEYDNAIAIYEEGIRDLLSRNLQTPLINKILTDLYESLGIVCFIIDKIEQALASFNTAIDQIQPEDSTCRVLESPCLAISKLNLAIFKIYMKQFRKDDALAALLTSINNLSQVTNDESNIVVFMSTELVISAFLLYGPNNHNEVLNGILKALYVWTTCHNYEELHLLSRSLLKVTSYKQCLNVLSDFLNQEELVSSDKVNVFHATITLILDICHLVMSIGNGVQHEHCFKCALNLAVNCIFKVYQLFPSCTMTIPIANLRLILSYNLGKGVTHLNRADSSKFLEKTFGIWNDRINTYDLELDEVTSIFGLVSKFHEQMGNFDDAVDGWEHNLSFMDTYKQSFDAFDWSRKMFEVIINLTKCYLKNGKPKEALESIHLMIDFNHGSQKLEKLVEQLDSNVPDPDHECWHIIVKEMETLFDHFTVGEEVYDIGYIEWDYIPVITKSKPLLADYDLPVLMKLLYFNEMKFNKDLKKQERLLPMYYRLNLKEIPRYFEQYDTSDIYAIFENKTGIEESEYIQMETAIEESPYIQIGELENQLETPTTQLPPPLPQTTLLPPPLPQTTLLPPPLPQTTLLPPPLLPTTLLPPPLPPTTRLLPPHPGATLLPPPLLPTTLLPAPLPPTTRLPPPLPPKTLPPPPLPPRSSTDPIYVNYNIKSSPKNPKTPNKKARFPKNFVKRK